MDVYIVMVAPEVDSAAATKIVADLTLFDKHRRGILQGTSFPQNFPLDRVKRLGSDLGDIPTTTPFYHVPYMKTAALMTEDADVSVHAFSDTDSAPQFYRRKDVETIWKAIDALLPGKILFVRGQPGTGKSTSIWRKVLMLAAKEQKGDSNVLWISLDRYGEPRSVVYFQGCHYYSLKLRKNEMELFLTATANEDVPLDVLIVDGINQEISADLIGEATAWIENDPTSRRAIFSSSSKVEELRAHQNNTTRYLTVQSWTLEEFQSACINSEGGKPTPFYHQVSQALNEFCLEAEDEDDIMSDDEESGQARCDGETLALACDPEELKGAEATDGDNVMSQDEEFGQARGDSKSLAPILQPTDLVQAALKAKYRWSGGSARWMFNYSRARIESFLRDYCNQIDNRNAILQWQIGPRSKASTNYFFGSSLRNDRKITEYFLVSQEAVRILAESAGRTTFEKLYAFADYLENPAFVGWIIEADFFFQLDTAIKEKNPFLPLFQSGGNVQPISVLPYDHTKCGHLLLSANASLTHKKIRARKFAKIKSIASSFVPDSEEKAIAGKPIHWNQGGYDVFFVELAPADQATVAAQVHVYLRFVQVTKGKTHDLKAGYLYAVVKFFEAAGYAVNEVEIVFLLTDINSVGFTVEGVEADTALAEYCVYRGKGAKWSKIDDSSVKKYELLLSKSSC